MRCRQLAATSCAVTIEKAEMKLVTHGTQA